MVTPHDILFRALNSSFFLKMGQKIFKRFLVFSLCHEYKSVNHHTLLWPNKGVLYRVLMAVGSVTYWSWHTQSLYLLLLFCFWVLQAFGPHKGLACEAGPLLVPPLLLNIYLVSPKWQKIEKALLAVTSETKRMVGVDRPQPCENDG